MRREHWFNQARYIRSEANFNRTWDSSIVPQWLPLLEAGVMWKQRFQAFPGSRNGFTHVNYRGYLGSTTSGRRAVCASM